VTIHSGHPFPTPSDPARRFRGRVAGGVTLWTAGVVDDDAAGLSVTSLMFALGEEPNVLALLDPDSDLLELLRETGRAVVVPLQWEDRGLAEAFAGTAPAPGGPFRQASWQATPFGPRLETATTWAGIELVDEREVGWSMEVRARLVQIEVGDGADVLLHHRGRFHRL
jgi:flavin reductase (DIM6/NTAB) family NADH-FMN oxidoreductase RutF